MPTQRQHPGAAIQHIPLTLPGFKGLNTQSAAALLGVEWATRLENCVLDQNNRVASRKGWNSVTTTTPLPASAQFEQIAEYRSKAGTVVLVASADDGNLYKSTDDGDSWSDVTNTATVTDNNMQFVNFNDSMIGFQDGDSPVIFDGTNFSDLTDAGNQPQGNAAVAAFGRVWAADSNGVDMKYSALLNETDWSSSDSGTLSMENVWPESDTIVAIAAWNGSLAVFGENNIIIWSDGKGSAVGIDPLEAYVVDVVSGIGCIARDSVQNVKGDMWFLSRNGIQSLGRLIQEKSNPLNNLTMNIQDELIEAINDPSQLMTRVRSVYSPEDRFYLLSLPRTVVVGSTDTETGRAWCLDTRGLLEDGTARVMGQWTTLVPRSIVKRRNNGLYFAITNAPSELGEYDGYTDNGASIAVLYESGWIDVTGTSGFLIIPKRIDMLLALSVDSTVTIKWAFDFKTTFRTAQKHFTGVGAAAEWGEAEWGNAEWGGGNTLVEGKVAGSGTGEFIKLGLSASLDGGFVAIQQMDLFAKIGRYK